MGTPGENFNMRLFTLLRNSSRGLSHSRCSLLTLRGGGPSEKGHWQPGLWMCQPSSPIYAELSALAFFDIRVSDLSTFDISDT